ncbi:MAG: hypothetical protein GY863_03290, partial [bacterium]|nr:hypothetical protein [bacterium]
GNLSHGKEIYDEFKVKKDEVKELLNRKHNEYVNKGNMKYANYIKNEFFKDSGGLFSKLTKGFS